MKVRFKKTKETEGTIRYKEIAEQGKAPCIGTLYVQKWFAAGREEITIEVPEAK
jgi:hypothetical protein